ncbi:MAG: hypothetical protein ABIJ96_16940 [Elusimicrobiota bacterium]
MPLGLHARIEIKPDRVLGSNWYHDMANVFCRGKIRAEVDFLSAQRTYA